jgi:hypothetical protein
MGSFLTTVITGITKWGTYGSGQTPDTAPLHETIFKILTEAPNFLASVLNYIPPFLFQLNATWDGRLAFEPNQFIEAPNGRLIQAPIEDIVFNLSGDHDLPLAQVIVQSQLLELYTYGGNVGTADVNTEAAHSGLSGVSTDVSPQNADLAGLFNTLVYSSMTMRFLSKYPAVPTVTAGKYMTVIAPSWTLPTSYTTADIGENNLSEGNDLADLSASAPNRFTNANNIYSTQQKTNMLGKLKSRVPVLDYLARLTYGSCVLDRGNAFVSIPLNMQVQVGRTYDLQSMEGNSLYNGFLNSVTHTITLGQQGAAATTSLDFSHVVVTGAQLNGINVSSLTTAAPDLPGETVSDSVASLS